MALEARLGMFVIMILVAAFGFLVYRRMDLHERQVLAATDADTTSVQTPADSESEFGDATGNADRDVWMDASADSVDFAPDANTDPFAVASGDRASETATSGQASPAAGAHPDAVPDADFDDFSWDVPAESPNGIETSDGFSTPGPSQPADDADDPFALAEDSDLALTPSPDQSADPFAVSAESAQEDRNSAEHGSSDAQQDDPAAWQIAAEPDIPDEPSVAGQPADEEVPFPGFHEPALTDSSPSPDPGAAAVSDQNESELLAFSDDIRPDRSEGPGRNRELQNETTDDADFAPDASFASPSDPSVQNHFADFDVALAEPEGVSDQADGLTLPSAADVRPVNADEAPPLTPLFPDDIPDSHGPQQQPAAGPVAPGDLETASAEVPFPSADSQETISSRSDDRAADTESFDARTFLYDHQVTPAAASTEPCAVCQVEPNDSYWKISRRVYGTSRYFSALALYNSHRIPDPKRLRPGMKVLIPEPDVLEEKYPQLFRDVSATHREPAGFFVRPDGSAAYRIGERDTLSDIARRHLGRASRWIQIYRLNRQVLSNPNRLKPGTVIVLPDDATDVHMAP